MSKYVSKKFNPFIYPDWAEIFKTMDSEQRSEVLMAITCFPNYEPRGVALWSFFKSQLQNQYDTWLERSEIYRSNAKSRKTNDSEENQLPATESNGEQLLPIATNSNQLSVNRTVYKQEQEYINTTTTSPSLDFDSVNDELNAESQESSQAEPELAEDESKKNPSIPYTEIMNLYNSICVPGCIRCRMLNPGRRTLIRQRTNDLLAYWDGDASSKQDIIECFRRLFQRVSSSDFLMGRTQKGQGHENWQADLSWILKAENCTKLIEEKYR